MLRLWCAVVGVSGTAFCVDVDENKTISYLSRVIKEAKKEGFKKFDANELFLYQAMQGDI
ncbi:hypothetical protein P3T76_007745 [Phytophthora citrophthora]|uniref:Crinkler effector protein N-terminal domain-containing protein n=1 Tax=Phytophthora citrophthora TaxID=4793 RepID=A0AAD9GLN3_9STRA|nr:hypothetical protein P3T76_007745 [Phytophthora citrophthora]